LENFKIQNKELIEKIKTLEFKLNGSLTKNESDKLLITGFTNEKLMLIDQNKD